MSRSLMRVARLGLLDDFQGTERERVERAAVGGGALLVSSAILASPDRSAGAWPARSLGRLRLSEMLLSPLPFSVGLFR